MSRTHWKKLQNPDYLGAYALEPGQELAVTIKDVKREMVTGPDGKKEECTVMYFVEPHKPMIVNTTNAKTIEKLHKTPYIEDWKDKKIQLYVDKVKAFGEVVDALRVRPFLPRVNQVETPKCVDCKENITAFGGKTAAQVASYTTNKYGRALCSECATKAAGEEPQSTEGEQNNA